MSFGRLPGGASEVHSQPMKAEKTPASSIVGKRLPHDPYLKSERSFPVEFNEEGALHG